MKYLPILLLAVAVFAQKSVREKKPQASKPPYANLECDPAKNLCGSSAWASTTIVGVVGVTPEWVPDPSAGHYDCPNGWTAYEREEPLIFSATIAMATIYRQPTLDKKGHELRDRPAPPLCVQDPPPSK